MDQAFKVGEIAILQNCVTWPHLNGTEVTITEPCIYRKRQNECTGEIDYAYAYMIDLRSPNGTPIAPTAAQLRKRRPPESYTGEQRIIAMFKPATQPERVES